MATKLTTITNISNQIVPILLNDIASSKANTLSDVVASEKRQLSIIAGAQVRVESQRLDLSQLTRLRSLGLLTFQST